MTHKELQKTFASTFGEGDEARIFFSPGRINLIGEHIDYNGGKVLPAALSIGITALVRPNNSSRINMISLNAEGKTTVDLTKKIEAQINQWGNYPRGIIHHLLQLGISLQGCDVLFYSNLP
ncbi:MAG: galactokinase family protein, partial [Flavobacteriales bacterium]